MQTTAPLTARMREALVAHEARQRRILYWVFGLFAILLGGYVAVLLRSSKGFSAVDKVALEAGLVAIPLLMGAFIVWYERRKTRRAFEAGVYALYTGPFTIESSGGKYPKSMLRMGEALVLATTITPRDTLARVRKMDSGSVAYIDKVPIILAVWDNQGRVVFQLPQYDLSGDSEISRLPAAPPAKPTPQWR